ncbi:MAG: LysR family transcriptional regulator, partial [Desulfotomaculaceae bacterium]|nr:LysR family transcriptional regulator [Desulfotomaculaceae bacterium]
MEIHQLEYVLAVANHKSFSRAAEEIKISQPSLSQQIFKLENELGTNLFVRTTRCVNLTPAGREFISHARNIMSELKQARHCIQEYATIKKGHLSFGALSVVGYYNIPNLVSCFQSKYPGIKLNIFEGKCEELLNMLHSTKIDAAFVQITKPDDRFRLYKLVTDVNVLVTNHGHPFANRRSVNLEELKNERFILSPATSGHYQNFCNSCQKAHFVPNVVLKCSVVKTMLGFVREGLGVTVLSSNVAAAEYDAGIKIIPITPEIQSEIALVTRNSANLPPILKL